MSRRETFLDVPDQVTLAPGPAHYNPSVKVGESRSLVGHAVMASRVSNPGAGRHNHAFHSSGKPVGISSFEQGFTA